MNIVFLEGKKIFLGPLSKNAPIQEYASWLNDQETTAFMGSGKFPSSMESISSYIDTYESNSKGFLLGIFLRASKKHIGNITLHQIDWKDRRGEIGIMIGDKKQWGKGYGTEAIKLVVEHAFNKLNLHKVCAGYVEGNVGSKKAFEKVGFKVEGVLKEHYYLNGEYNNCFRLGLLQSQYKK